MIWERRELLTPECQQKDFLLCPILWVSREGMVNAFEADTHYPRSDFGNMEKKGALLCKEWETNTKPQTDTHACLGRYRRSMVDHYCLPFRSYDEEE